MAEGQGHRPAAIGNTVGGQLWVASIGTRYHIAYNAGRKNSVLLDFLIKRFAEESSNLMD
jgi:hypothetical protein